MGKQNHTILVFGSTGKQGNAVTKSLLSRGWNVRAVSRQDNSDKVNELKTLGADMIKVDMSSLDSIKTAMKNVYGVYSVQPFDPNNLEKEISQGKLIADAAKQMEVSHFIYASAAGTESYGGADNFATKWAIEEHIRSIDLPFTVLRLPFFMDNLIDFTEIDSNQLIIQGFMDPDIQLQMISARDIGEFAAIIFDNPEKFIGEYPEIAGDELSLNQVKEIFSQTFDVDCKIKDVRQEFQESMSMFKWFETNGYDINIGEVRLAHPDLFNLKDWLKNSQWSPFK